VSNFLVGRRGEDRAVRFLEKGGYRILGRNVRARIGEIDVVAQEGATLCFVEIKMRASERFGLPEEALTAQKRGRLVRLAKWYLQSRPRWQGSPIRFDVLSILPGEERPGRIRLIKGAFEVV